MKQFNIELEIIFFLTDFILFHVELDFIYFFYSLNWDIYIGYIYLEQVSLEAGIAQPLRMEQFYSAPAAGTSVQQLLSTPKADLLPEPPDPKTCK